MSIFTNEKIKYISLLLIFFMNLYAGTTGKIVGEVTDEDGNVKIEKVDLGTTTKSVKYSVFVPMLIKAVQELKAEIEELKRK